MAAKQQTLTLAQAAALAGRSERFIGNLREKGFVATVEHGKYPLVSLCRGLVAYLEEQVAKQADTARQTAATDARTREIELRIKRKAAKLIHRDDASAELDDWHAAISDEMGALASLEFDDADRQAAWQREIAASLARVDALTADAKARLKTGDHK
jgi:hypothetical protein